MMIADWRWFGAGGVVLALLLIRLRRVSALWLLPHGVAREVFSPSVPGILAGASLVLYLAIAALTVVFKSERRPRVAEIALTVLLFAAVPYSGMISRGASSALVELSGSLEAVLLEPTGFEGSPAVLTSPFTDPGHAETWGVVVNLQSLKWLTSDGPANMSQPYVVSCAERVQSRLGTSELHGAAEELDRLKDVDRSGPVWRLMRAKVKYAQGDLTGARDNVRRAISDVTSLGVRSLNTHEVERTLRAFDAYYSAADAAAIRDWEQVSGALLEYRRLSFDSFSAARVEGDPTFEEYVGTDEYARLKSEAAWE